MSPLRIFGELLPITLIITGRLEDGTPFVEKGIVKIKHVKTETYLK